jgi:hypothetical protein
MASEHEQNSEYFRSRQRESALDSHVDYDRETQHSPAGLLPGLTGLMQNACIGASCNAPVRVEGMRQMQGTHGNRAVQRALSTNGPDGRVAVQRETFTEATELYAEEMRNGRVPIPGDPAKEQAIWDAQKFLASSEPITSPMDAIGSEQPFGPTLDGGVSIAEEGAIEESIAMLDGNRAGGAAQSPAPYMPPAPPMQDVEGSFLGRFLNVGDINNMVDVGSTAGEKMAKTGSRMAKGMDMVGKGSDALGVGKGIYDFVTADDNYQRVQAGADTAVSAVGLFGGPLAGMFSAGYSVGQLLDKTFGLSDKLSGVLQDWDPLGLYEPSLDELSPDQLRSLAEKSPMRGWEVERELKERRGFAVRSQNRRLAREDAQKQQGFEKEMAAISEQIGKGPAGLGAMLGTAGDAHSSQAILQDTLVRVSGAVEEEALAPVSMRLPR